MKHLLAFIIACVGLCFYTSCTNEPSYPSELTEADSLIQHGRYQAARSLLARFDSSSAKLQGDVMAYRQLLELELKFVSETLSEHDFSLSDSLNRFYKENHYLQKQAMSFLILGHVCHKVGDHPAALHHYLQAKEICEAYHLSVMQGWTSQVIGDLYFDQRMFDECLPYFLQFYHIAQARCDTLRIALASCRLGRVFTIENNIDSTLFYYKQALRMGEQQKQTPNTLLLNDARIQLTDILIQTEQFAEAEKLMTRMPDDLQNWAYWHLGQQHIDSAVHYLRLLLNEHEYGWEGKVWFLRELATIEQQRGRLTQANAYYCELSSAYDSLQVFSQTEETRHINAQYNYNQICQQRDAEAHHAQIMQLLLLLVCIIVLLVAVLALRLWKQYKRTKEAELAQLEQFRIEDKRQYLLRLQKIEACGKQPQATDEPPILQYVRTNAIHDDFYLSEEQWEQLITAINSVYNQFTTRLLALNGKLTTHEIRVCCLIKLGLPSVVIARMLYKTDKAIFMTRQRLFVKLTSVAGTARQLNNFINNF